MQFNLQRRLWGSYFVKHEEVRRISASWAVRMDEVEATNVLLDHGADIHKMAKQVNVSVKTPISPNLPPCHQHALTAMEVGGRNCGVRQARGLGLAHFAANPIGGRIGGCMAHHYSSDCSLKSSRSKSVTRGWILRGLNLSELDCCSESSMTTGIPRLLAVSKELELVEVRQWRSSCPWIVST